MKTILSIGHWIERINKAVNDSAAAGFSYCRFITGLIFTGSIALLPPTVHAVESVQDKFVKKENSWSGNAELGYVDTGGNTQITTINAKGRAQLSRAKWLHTVNVEAFNSAENEQRTAERYFISGQSDYRFAERRYFFVIVSAETDKFSGFEHRISESVGYGRRVFARDTMYMDMELGPGARQSKPDKGDSDNEFILRLAAKYQWDINKGSTLHQDFTMEKGESAVINKSVTSLSVKVADDLAMKMSHTIKHNSNVPTGVEKRDTETAVTLVYSFK